MENGLSARKFVIDWLNHFNYMYEVDVEINSKLILDFLIKDANIGVFVIDWKKPISVKVANKAIQIQRELDLDQLFLIAKEISEPAQKTIERYGPNVKTMHPNGLSELAVYLAQSFHKNATKATS